MKRPYWIRIRRIIGRLNCFRGVHGYRWSMITDEFETPKKQGTFVISHKTTWCGYCGHVKDRKVTHKIKP